MYVYCAICAHYSVNRNKIVVIWIETVLWKSVRNKWNNHLNYENEASYIVVVVAISNLNNRYLTTENMKCDSIFTRKIYDQLLFWSGGYVLAHIIA